MFKKLSLATTVCALLTLTTSMGANEPQTFPQTFQSYLDKRNDDFYERFDCPFPTTLENLEKKYDWECSHALSDASYCAYYSKPLQRDGEIWLIVNIRKTEWEEIGYHLSLQIKNSKNAQPFITQTHDFISSEEVKGWILAQETNWKESTFKVIWGELVDCLTHL